MTKTEIINGTKINYQGNEYGVIPEAYLEDPYKVREIKQNGIAIDIGACIGTFCLRAAKERGCTIYAYEPYPGSYKLAVENVNINGLGDKVKLFDKAVVGSYDKCHDMKRDLNVHPKHFAGNTFHPGPNTKYEKISVVCTTLKDVFSENHLQKCDFLKMDCEGEEKDIIKGLDTDTLEKIDKIVMEYHLYVDGREIMEHLRNVWFDVRFSTGYEQPNVERSVLYATRKK